MDVAVNSVGVGFVLLYGLLLGLATVTALMLRSGLRGAGDALDTFESRLHPLEIAYLVGGPVRAMETAVASVRHRTAIPVSDRAQPREALNEVLINDVVPTERAIYTLIARHGGEVERARREADPVLTRVRSRLTWLKLLAPEPSVRQVRRVQLLLFGAVLAFGVARVAAVERGAAPGRPSDAFVVLLSIAAAWLLTRVQPPLPYRSRRGDRMLEHLRAKHIALLWKLREQPHGLPATDFALAVALFGENSAELALLGALPYRNRAAATPRTSSSVTPSA
jgi:uncharacterized protein (TIGR04222 family)